MPSDVESDSCDLSGRLGVADKKRKLYDDREEGGWEGKWIRRRLLYCPIKKEHCEAFRYKCVNQHSFDGEDFIKP